MLIKDVLRFADNRENNKHGSRYNLCLERNKNNDILNGDREDDAKNDKIEIRR